jgi:hypothetical protein
MIRLTTGSLVASELWHPRNKHSHCRCRTGDAVCGAFPDSSSGGRQLGRLDWIAEVIPTDQTLCMSMSNMCFADSL